MNKPKIGIWGWWQGHNLGDNWIKKVLSIAFPYAEFVPTSVLDFKNYDFIICGGGGLFVYDVIEPWLTYRITVPYGMIGLGAEFAHTSDTAQMLEAKSKFFYVRDKYSVDCMNVSDKTASYDCTFYKPVHWVKKENIKINNLFFVWRDGRELISNKKFETYIQYDADAWNHWNQLLHQRFSTIICDDFHTEDDDIESHMADSGFVVSGRYHGIIAAIQKGLPFIAIDICPKIRALLKECDLEKYCIKINEYEKLDELVTSALNNIELIRSKEAAYRETANKKISRDIRTAQKEIYRICKPYKAIHYGSYWMGKNDIVNTMSDDLAEICRLEKIDLRAYTQHKSKRIRASLQAPNTKISILDHKRIMLDVFLFRPDFIIMNSAGLVLEDKTFQKLKQLGIKTIGMEMSDPDVYPYNGAIYAHKYDLFYTNSKYSFLNQYNSQKVNIRIMPFAASQKHHYYMPDVKKVYDLVIVGHARPDRIELVRQLEKNFKVGTYGNGWEHSLGVVSGIEHIKAINSGKIYLSFSKTMAGFDNIKVGLFEAIACNQVVITSYMDELNDYFEIGKEVLCYKSESEIPALIEHFLTHEQELEAIRQRAYKKFLSEHTYVDRWVEVLNDIGTSYRYK